MSQTPSDKNTVIVASAGSRKTTQIVEDAIAATEKRILITTFTNENVDQVRRFFIERCGLVPGHVTVLSWYSFLVRHGIRPYQNYLTVRPPIEILFDDLSNTARFSKQKAVDQYYFNSNGMLFKDRAAEFVCACNTASSGKVISRLGRVFDHIYIDEFQDLAGHDLEIVKLLFGSTIQVTAVGDPRQGTFSTNRGQKNAKFRRDGILDWIDEQKRAGLISVFEKSACYRSNQMICDFADDLYPGFPRTKSMNTEATGHDGIFTISRSEVSGYIEKYKPFALRWNKRADTMGVAATNIGITKGRTFDRVLIFPTKPMLAYLKSKDLKKAGALSTFYVAVTRARFSVAFVDIGT